MTSNNVSMIMAPNLFLAPRSTRHHRRKTDHPGLELAMFASTAQIIKMMIKYEEIIWIVRVFLVRTTPFYRDHKDSNTTHCQPSKHNCSRFSSVFSP